MKVEVEGLFYLNVVGCKVTMYDAKSFALCRFI